MPRYSLKSLRSLAIVTTTVLVGIAWSFSLFHVRTRAYPLIGALAMPALAFYYFTGTKRTGVLKHVPAGAVSIYAVVLWMVSRGYGLFGTTVTVFAVIASFVAVWAGGRLTRPVTVAEPFRAAATPPVRLGSGVARRRHLRTRAAGRH
jgi:hypothetical protein